MRNRHQLIFIHVLAIALALVPMCPMPLSAGEPQVGQTIDIAPRSVWFEKREHLSAWQVLHAKGDAAALTDFEREVLGGREAWQLEAAQTVKIISHDAEKRQLEVEMTAPGRFQGTKWFVAADAQLETSAAGQVRSSRSAVEDIYILRSVRETRQNPPTAFCDGARTRLGDPAWEDYYAFRTVATDGANGLVIDAETKPAGTIHACFGRTADTNIMELYGELAVHGISGKAFGKCHSTKSDFPEKGIRLFACIFDIYDLPEQYVGGQLTTNSVTSPKLFGTLSEPEGYTQVSIATLRLWKKR